MAKPFIVIFSDRGARKVKGINPDDWQGVPNVLVNPDLSKVSGVPPHLWALVDGKVEQSSQENVSQTVFVEKFTRSYVFYIKVALLSAGVSALISSLLCSMF
jgi:hypothetical protein